MSFIDFSNKISKQIDKMVASGRPLFIVSGEIWDLYLDSFPDGTNKIYKERREYDCQHCKNFIRDVGNVVTVNDDKTYSTIWDVDVDEPFQTVANKIRDVILTKPIFNIFLTDTRKIGVAENSQLLPNNMIKWWNHLYCRLDSVRVVKESDKLSILSDSKSSFDVLSRGLKEITLDAINLVLKSIEDNQIYRGQEFKDQVESFRELKLEYDVTPNLYRDRYVWLNYNKKPARIRNTAIGTLLQNISNDMDCETAVNRFEKIVAPTNYKRPKPIITERMVNDAMKTIENENLERSLYRRFAKISDISINDILFADRDVQPAMKNGLKSSLMDSIVDSTPLVEKTLEINIEDFIENIIPETNSLKVMFDGKLENNLVSLISPKFDDATPLFKWGNPFSWSYNGNLTDSVKDKVKKAGGNVDGFLRVSLAWKNTDDLDIHVKQPNGEKIWFGSRCDFTTGGKLDIDMNASTTVRDPVENVTWSDPRKMLIGVYKVYVNNYQQRESIDYGFEIELECGNTILNLKHEKPVNHKESVFVIRFDFDGENIKILKTNSDCELGRTSKDVWNLKTNKFQDVSLVTLSPNHWCDTSPTGNKHYMFIMNGCKNPDKARGFYNEYLPEKYMKHRKVFETLADKTRCEKSDDQLSGLGFSSTVKNSLICKVNNGKNYKVNFGN